jgi:hypothetical protein
MKNTTDNRKALTDAICSVIDARRNQAVEHQGVHIMLENSVLHVSWIRSGRRYEMELNPVNDSTVELVKSTGVSRIVSAAVK